MSRIPAAVRGEKCIANFTTALCHHLPESYQSAARAQKGQCHANAGGTRGRGNFSPHGVLQKKAARRSKSGVRIHPPSGAIFTYKGSRDKEEEACQDHTCCGEPRPHSAVRNLNAVEKLPSEKSKITETCQGNDCVVWVFAYGAAQKRAAFVSIRECVYLRSDNEESLCRVVRRAKVWAIATLRIRTITHYHIFTITTYHMS